MSSAMATSSTAMTSQAMSLPLGLPWVLQPTAAAAAWPQRQAGHRRLSQQQQQQQLPRQGQLVSEAIPRQLAATQQLQLQLVRRRLVAAGGQPLQGLVRALSTMMKA